MSTRVLRVAVTGVGGGCGQGIMKALFASRLPVEVFPVDVTPFSAGLYRGRCGGAVLPKPEENPDAWRVWALAKGIQAIIPGSDHDLLPLAQVRDEWLAEHGIHVLVSDTALVRTANDKHLTALFLARHGLAAPKTLTGAVTAYPVVIKPRFGMTSRGVQVCADAEELAFWRKRTEHPVVQDYLPGDEYTCALFFTPQQRTLLFIARRWLYAGSTYRAEVIPLRKAPADLLDYLRSIALVARPLGALNVQLKLVPGRGPVAFELNVRCSGSTMLRAISGYNEPELLLRAFVLGESVRQPVYAGGFFFRFWEELYLPGMAAAQLEALSDTSGLKGQIPAWL